MELKEGESKIHEFTDVFSGDSGDGKAGSLLITTHRFFFFKNGKISHELTSEDLRNPNIKIQSKVDKANPPTKSFCRVLNGKVVSCLYIFKGSDCNDRVSEFTHALKKFKSSTPPKNEDPLDSLEKNAYSIYKLKESNPVLNKMLEDENYKEIIDEDAINFFSNKLIDIYANQLADRIENSTIEFKPKKYEVNAVEKSTGDNFALDKQMINQMLRRRPELLKKYKEVVKDQETMAKFFMEDFPEYLNENKAEKEKKKNSPKTEEKFDDFNKKAMSDNLHDANPLHGLVIREEVQPGDLSEINEINAYTKHVLSVQEEAERKAKEQQKEEKQQEEEKAEGETGDDESVKEMQILEKSVEESDIDEKEWRLALSALDSNIKSLQKDIETEGTHLRIGGTQDEYRKALLDMEYDKDSFINYDEEDKDELFKLSKRTTELLILSSTYWDAVNKNNEERAAKIREVVNKHKDAGKNLSPSSSKFVPFYENINLMYKAILN